jgi:NAD(P)-dependent dehydrogenase (short-subunit alcohol dehydrogenase family)
MKNKHAIVTGAGGHLAQAVITRLLNNGYTVSGILSAGKDTRTDTPGLHRYAADLADEASVVQVMAAIIRREQRLDAAVLLAGGFRAGHFENSTADSLNAMLRMNFETAYWISREVFKHLRQQPGGGRIILTGARPGLDVSRGTFAAEYALSKSLVFRLAELLNAEGKGHGVSASVIVPGTIDTPANRAAMPGADTSRWTAPEAIATLIATLCENKPGEGHPALVEC